jgi:hypothetical protein
MTMRIAIHQTCRVERRIVIEIDAPNPEEACERLASGDVDIPPFDDPRWVEAYSLEHEEYRPA